jgi:hypothetical protein
MNRYASPFSFHTVPAPEMANKKQIWDDQAQVDHVLEYCPEVKIILGMKLDNDKPKGVP